MDNYGDQHVIADPHMMPFGEKPHQVMLPEVAESILRDLFANHPVMFAQLMARAYGIDDIGIAPVRGRRRSADAAG